MTQFSDLQQRVLDYGFSDAKYRPYVKTWLNEGQRKIAAKADLRLFFNASQFATSTFNNSLPDDFLRVHPTDAVSYSSDATDWVPLDPLELRDFDDLAVSYGVPTSYVVAGQVLYLYPYPDSEVNITLIYYRKPVDMDADTDEPELPDTYEDIMVSWALKRAFEREADFESAAYWASDFNQSFSDLQGQLQSDTNTSPNIVPGMWANLGYSAPVIPR